MQLLNIPFPGFYFVFEWERLAAVIGLYFLRLDDIMER